MQSAINLRGVERTYEGEVPVRALRTCSLAIDAGEYVAITGPSGSGKTTMLNILGLLDSPTTGSYFLQGIDVRDLGDAARSRLRAVHIGFVFQASHLIPHRTAVENIETALMYQACPYARRRVLASGALEQVGLGNRLDAMPGELSGGERQRVAIARAIVGAPTTLLCDEPTGNLDAANSRVTLRLLESLNADGRTIVLVTHDSTVAARARRLVAISDGSIVEDRSQIPWEGT